MKKLLVLFPGIGYSTARPLLYYAKRMGQEKGYEVLELEYSRMPEHPFDNLKETAKTVCACAEAWAKHVDWEKYDKIAFVSKSVGTVAAGFLTRDPRMKERKKYGLKAARRAPQFSKR